MYILVIYERLISCIQPDLYRFFRIRDGQTTVGEWCVDLEYVSLG